MLTSPTPPSDSDVRPRPDLAPTSGVSPVIEIVVPVYNEQAVLDRSIRRLHDFLTREMPFTWRIVIADNASTDATPWIARTLSHQLQQVSHIRLAQKGRGRALRTAWMSSDADVLCYMDVDLSTDLRALLPLVASLISGHSDVAIGTRLSPGSRVARGLKRELISRTYNRLLHVALRARFSDAQCGFKAVRADIARELIPRIDDNEWFFDTELLVLAQQRGLRIHEVAVDWTDDPDSRVDIVSTALADLRGIVRLLAGRPVPRFLAIGVLSTIAYAALYLLLRAWISPDASNAIALAVTAAANTQANRRFTFRVTGREGLVRQHAAGAIVYLLALALTAGSLEVLQRVDPHPARAVEVAVLMVASAAATVTRYIALRTWVFARHRRERQPLQPLTE